ncbi:hypothetical protein ACWY4P_03420 [Streptomyces sp. LZ34]
MATSLDFTVLMERAGLEFREISGKAADHFNNPAVIKAIHRDRCPA